MPAKQAIVSESEAHQTVRLPLDTNQGSASIRISFTDQRLTAHGGRIVWSHFLHPQQFRRQLDAALPHAPTSPNAYTPADIALGFLGGILTGADKLSRVAVCGEEARQWWRELLRKLTAPPNCHAVGSLQA